MLQWMGGSRRKVATSRKSTYKRQKQYFEQRKRQNEQTASLDVYADVNYSSNQNFQNKRSLDVLSLVNVSTAAQIYEDSPLIEKSESEDDVEFALDHQNPHSPVAIHDNEYIYVDQSQQEENSPSYPIEKEYSKKVSAQIANHKEKLDGHNNKLDHVDLSSARQLSVIDLLGDGGASKNIEQNSVHGREAHVAFSIEGLGKVETQTPVHSPEIPGRASLNDFSSQRKSRRQLFPSQHLDSGFDDIVYMEDTMTQDDDFLPNEGFVEQSFYVRDTIRRNPSLKFSSFRNSSQSKWNNRALKGVFDDDELLCGTTDIWSGTSEIWNGPSFLEENFDYLGEYESFSKDWMDQRDFNCDGYSNIKNQQMQDFGFDIWSLENKRSRTYSKRTPNYFDMAEPLPYRRPQIHDELPDFKVPDMSWYPNVGVNSDDAKDTLNRFVDDTRESLSLLSEESTTSTAVRGDATKPLGDVGS